MSHACHRFWKCYKAFTFRSLLTRCTIPCACHAKRHLNVQKCSEPISFFALLTSKCASPQRRAKSALRTVCFVHFGLETCFAPQRRAFCHHLNFQKWSETGSLLHFWRRMCFAPQRRATSCNFSSLIWPHGSAPAALASLLFDPPEPQIIGKNTVFRGFPPFLRTCIFFLLTLSLLWSSLFGSSPPWLSPPLLFHLSILSGSPGNDLLMVAFRS